MIISEVSVWQASMITSTLRRSASNADKGSHWVQSALGWLSTHDWYQRWLRLHGECPASPPTFRTATLMCMPLAQRLSPAPRCIHQPFCTADQHLVSAVSAAAAAAFCLSHHAAEAFFAPACPASPGSWAARRPPPPPSRSSVATASATTAASTEDEVQRRHFFGYGDPDHVPSILQNITAQRYIGERIWGAFVVETLGRLTAYFAFERGHPTS